MKLELTLPDGATVGDLTTASGALLKASAEFVDWEALHDGAANAVGKPGVILLDLGRQLDQEART